MKLNDLGLLLLANGWTGIMTGTLAAAIAMLIANVVTIYFFIKRIQHEKTDETSFAFRKNKFWVFFAIRYVYIAAIVLLAIGMVVALAIFIVSAVDNF